MKFLEAVGHSWYQPLLFVPEWIFILFGFAYLLVAAWVILRSKRKSISVSLFIIPVLVFIVCESFFWGLWIGQAQYFYENLCCRTFESMKDLRRLEKDILSTGPSQSVIFKLRQELRWNVNAYNDYLQKKNTLENCFLEKWVSNHVFCPYHEQQMAAVVAYLESTKSVVPVEEEDVGAIH